VNPTGTAGTGGITAATPPRVFLSHTSDLGRPGEAGSFVAAAVAAMFAARETSPAAACDARIAQSDVHVGIIGLQHGGPSATGRTSRAGSGPPRPIDLHRVRTYVEAVSRAASTPRPWGYVARSKFWSSPLVHPAQSMKNWLFSRL